MLSTAFALSLGLVVGQTPDESDILRSAANKPMIQLVLDQSGSMGGGALPTPCAYFDTNVNGGAGGANHTLDKNEMMLAALTGCQSATDGIIDTWAALVDFSVAAFPSGGSAYGALASFTANQAGLEAAVLSIGTGGGNTPMSGAMVEAGRYFSTALSDTGIPGTAPTLACRKNFILLLSDGNPNGGAHDADYECTGVPDVHVPAGQPWLGAQYNYDGPDIPCLVTGSQTINTYTIGFGAPGSFSPATLQNIAASGGGQYFYASNVDQLNVAFENIIFSMVDRSAVFNSVGSVQRNSFFAGDHMYVPAYRPRARGAWSGNLKKLRLAPAKLADGSFDPTDVGAYFVTADGKTLTVNPAATDLWSGTNSTDADVGGANQLLRARLGTPPGAPPVGGWRPRAIYTYRPGVAGYLSLQPGAAGITDTNLFVSNGELHKLINRIHGYSFDRDPANGNPIALAAGAIGDVVHSDAVVLRYGPDCTVANTCFIVLPTNNGVIHFMEASTGAERVALVPGELWRPGNVSKHRLADLDDQPNQTISRRYYVDGPAQVFHADYEGDGVINPTDEAFLVFGLGRGGRAYYSMNLIGLDAALTASNLNGHALRPITYNSANAWKELREAWANPWLGQAKLGAGGSVINVAVLTSGHISALDVPTTMVPNLAPGPTVVQSESAPTSVPCAALLGASCSAGIAGFDPGIDMSIGPLAIPDAIGYRVHFSAFNFDPNDRIYVEDSLNRWSGAFTGLGVSAEPLSPGLSGGWSPWVYSNKLAIRVVTDGAAGICSPFAPCDVTIDTIEYITATPGANAAHFPTVYVTGLNGWNTAAKDFQALDNADSVIARFTKNCASAGGSAGACFDTTDFPDLANMTCPISAEPSVYTVNNKLQAIYWADECAQIFVATLLDGAANTWSAKRLAVLSGDPAAPTAYTTQTGMVRSADIRKIYSKLSLVPSLCQGRRSVGVYFETGDVQRPVAFHGDADPTHQYLENVSYSNGRDILGVVFDEPGVSNRVLNQLVDATLVAKVSPKLANGWFFSLAPSEKGLRDPLVFQGAAYFKTFEPTNSATECNAGAGTDRVYIVNNCTAEALIDSNGDPNNQTVAERVATTTNEDIGPSPTLVTMAGAAPIVVTNGMLGGVGGTHQRTFNARPRPYMWRFVR